MSFNGQLQKQGNRRQEAESLLRQAVASSEGRRQCVSSRELAELLIHSGNDFQATDVVEAALQVNKRCVCCLTLRGDIYRRRGETNAAEKHYRVALDVNNNMIAALTGLAQLVSAEEAAELIDRAVEADPEDPRVLLARARLNTFDPPSQTKDAEAALELDPQFIEAHLLLSSPEVNRSNLEGAIGHIEAVLAVLPSREELIPSFVSAAMATTKLDNGVCLSSLLDRHENAVSVEPLAVAVHMVRGEKPMAAKEIMDVAWDIIVRSSSQ